MMNLAIKQAVWLLLPLALVAAHAVWVFSSISADKKSVDKPDSVESFALADRVKANSETHMKAFSLLMGVDPQMGEVEATSEAKDIRYFTLTELEPKLLAVDEVSDAYTARIWLDNSKLQAARKTSNSQSAEAGSKDTEAQPPEINPALKLYSLVQGESLFHYRVEEIGLSHVRLIFDPSVEHDWAEAPEELVLRLFNRTDASQTPPK